MENAAKALIIAAAILIAIVLISLGVYVMGVGQDQIKNGGMSDIEVTTFNQKFIKYQGEQKGSVVRTMVQDVMANNNSAEASEETMITVDGTAGVKLESGKDKTPTYGELKNTQTYNISIGYTNGRVSKITVNTITKNP